MKSFYFKDGLQIVAAILLTGSMAYAMQSAETSTVASQQAPATVQVQEPDSLAPEEQKALETAENKPEPVIDPNGCEPERYWAKEAPYECIDKPVQATSASNAGTSSPGASAPSGSCIDWMTAAGVPYTTATQKLIINESGCNPGAVNPTSGACGIPQALPCSKMPCTLEDPVCQLRWMAEYVRGRYNTWERALDFWYCIGTCYSNNGPVYKTTNWY